MDIAHGSFGCKELILARSFGGVVAYIVLLKHLVVL